MESRYTGIGGPFFDWFANFAPKAYRDTRLQTTKQVEAGLLVQTKDLSAISREVLEKNSEILPILRMATCPPLARDRLIGLAYANKNLVLAMESGKIAVKTLPPALAENLNRI